MGSLNGYEAVLNNDAAALDQFLQSGEPARISGELVNVMRERALQRPTLLHVAAMKGSRAIINMLLTHGAPIDCRDAKGLTPLHCAAEYGNYAAAGILLKRMAKVNQIAHNGRIPLHCAAERGDTKMMKLLISHGGVIDALDESGNSVIDLAHNGGHLELVAWLRGKYPLLRHRDVFEAIKKGDLKAIRDFYHHGTSIISGRRDGLEPLNFAIRYGEKEIVRFLLSKSGSIRVCDRALRKPLHYAAIYGQREIAEMLMDQGGAVDCADVDGKNPLHHAAENGHPEVIRLLLSRGARIEAKDRCSQTPVDCAKKEGNGEALDLLTAPPHLRRLGFFLMKGTDINPLVLNVPSFITYQTLVRMVTDRLKTLPGGNGFVDEKHYVLRPLEGAMAVAGRNDTVDEVLSKLYPRRIAPAEYDDVIEPGRYFIFCKESANGEFLRSLGFSRAPGIISRFRAENPGSRSSDLFIHPFGSENPLFRPLLAVAPERLVYSPGDKAAVFFLCAGKIGEGKAEVRLQSGGQDLPGLTRQVPLCSGLGIARWDALPRGHYTAVVKWGRDEAETSFTVGEFTRSAAHAEWIEGPSVEGGEWVAAFGLYLYGMPVARGTRVRLRLVTDSTSVSPEICAETDEEGAVKLRMPVSRSDCRVLQIGWSDQSGHTAELTLPGGDKIESAAGVTVMTAPHEKSVPASGLHISAGRKSAFPLTLVNIGKSHITLRASRSMAVAAFTLLFPGMKPVTKKYGSLRKDELIRLPLRARAGYGFLCLGAIGGGECYETLTPILIPTDISVSCDIPPVIRAGARVKFKIVTKGVKRTHAALIIRDIRLHAAGGLESAGAERMMENIGEGMKSLLLPGPSRFSEKYLEGAFAIHNIGNMKRMLRDGLLVAGAPLLILLAVVAIPIVLILDCMGQHPGGGGSSAGTTAEGVITVDLLPTERKKFGFGLPLADVACGIGDLIQSIKAKGNREPIRRGKRFHSGGYVIETGERMDTAFAGIIEIRGGSASVEVSMPPSPATYAVELFVVDPRGGGWAPLYTTSFRATREVEFHTGLLPSFIHPEDSGHVAAPVVISALEQVELEVRHNGSPIDFSFRDRSPGGMQEGGGGALGGDRSGSGEIVREIVIPVMPGLYELAAVRNGRCYREEIRVRTMGRISERVRKMIVLNSGQSFEINPEDHIFDLHFVSAPDEIFQNCGYALASYEHQCCEQTAAAMIGALLAATTGDSNFRDRGLRSYYAGLSRLERMWTGSGFKTYLDAPFHASWLGEYAYKHIAGIGTLKTILEMCPIFDKEIGEAIERATCLLQKAARVYGVPGSGGMRDCFDAYLSLDRRPEEALEFVRKRWSVASSGRMNYGYVNNPGSPAQSRSDTCYAGTVLLSEGCENAGRIRELTGTLNWIGSQMKEGGRLYSTIDSAALIPFLASARMRGLFGGGDVSFDASPPITSTEAQQCIRFLLPRSIRCVKGSVQIFVDMIANREIPDATPGSALPVWFEKDGCHIDDARVGSRLDLVVKAGFYEPGQMIQVALPPCLAFEEGGARMQVFQRDFQGHESLRIPCAAISDTGGRRLKGMAVLRNMYDEEKIVPASLQFCVRS